MAIRFISNFVRALADFIEFEQAVALSGDTLKASPVKAKAASDQLDAFWQRAMRAENSERGGKVDFTVAIDKAADEVQARRLERKRLAARQRIEREEAAAMREMLGAH